MSDGLGEKARGFADEAVEKAARALWGPKVNGPWENAPDLVKAHHRQLVRAVLEASGAVPEAEHEAAIKEEWEVGQDALGHVRAAHNGELREARSRADKAIQFIQKVAGAHRAICKLDHHAGTCNGAVGLADVATKLLVSLGIEPRFQRESSARPCALCDGGDYVIGEVWLQKWVHAMCLPRFRDSVARADRAEAAHRECREALEEARDAIYTLCLERGSTDGFEADFDQIDCRRGPCADLTPDQRTARRHMALESPPPQEEDRG